ncbi:MAG: glycosyltransferase [Candidatus Rokubacteria bacterium]|nr:glycosyltransferase [Candidatus Rokubacteria bacterium]
MKIVQAVGWYYPESLGGSEVYVAGLSQRLRAAGQDVTIAVPDPTGGAERTYDHEGVSVYRYPVPDAPTRAESQGRVVARGADRFHAWLARQRPDIVHAHTFVTGLGLAELKAARAVGARLFVTDHCGSLGWICQRGTMMRWGERLCDGICSPGKCAACALHHRGVPKPLALAVGAVPPNLGRVARALPGRIGTALGMSELIAHNQLMQREMLEITEKFVVLTEWAFEVVAANGAPREKLVLNRLGMSHHKIAAKPGPDERPTRTPIRVGYMGRFDTIKGIGDLVRSVTSLPRDISFRLELRGPVRTEAERVYVKVLQALSAGDPRIEFAPAVAPSEALDALATYDVLCCPSLFLEGGPTVAMEAQAVGTPVIGSRIGGLAEIVRDGINGRLVPPGDWRALSEVLAEIVRDPAGTVDRWRLALPKVRTMDEIAADYEALYAP